MKKTKQTNLRPVSQNLAKTASIEERIRQRAYEVYQASGGVNGRELDHWLQAEREIKASESRLSVI